MALFALLLFALASSAKADEASDLAEANVAAKAEIAHGMAEGVQNNIELRQMLAKKQVAEGNLDDAMEQHRHIIRIQTEKFGQQSEQAALAAADAAAHLEVLKKNERATMEAYLQDPVGLEASLTADQKVILHRNSRVRERKAQEAAAKGDNAKAGRIYR
jgi:hypothetical protein